MKEITAVPTARIVLMKDRDRHVIGFEKLNFSKPNEEGELLRVVFETLTA